MQSRPSGFACAAPAMQCHSIRQGALCARLPNSAFLCESPVRVRPTLGSLGWALTFRVCALSCVLALEPKNGRAYLRRAMTYQRAGRCVPYIAISTARCSAEAQKGFAAHPIAWHVRVPARCYSSFRPAEALEDLDTAVDVTPPSGRDEALS
jgi:hypothetical protein